MQVSMQTRTCMLDNSQIQATFHATSRTFDQIMSSVCCCYCRFCFCLIRYFLFFLVLFYQRSLSTSLSNSTECFCVPRSRTDHLPRRNKRHRKQSQWPLLLSIEWVFSLHRKYLVETSTLRSKRKLFLFTGCLCYSSSSDAVFLDGRFLLDADRGNLSLLLRCESLQH